jgi:NADH-ubiquinone oxidoreductase chain 2
MIIGSIGGLVKDRIKRLLAYSAISHVGLILLALAMNSVEGYKSLMFYLMQYSITNVNIFFILITIGYLLYKNIMRDSKLIDKLNSPIQYIYQLKGFYEINPILCLSLAISIFSLLGIPPLVGFFSKQ